MSDPRDDLPLYAGGDLEPAERDRLEQALAADPALREELAGWEELEGLLRRGLDPRAELRELLPLYAGGDLEPAERTRVEDGLRTWPELREELRPHQELDALLRRGLAPRRASEPLRVRVQCPYCHDALGASERVLCATCATPHHAECFAQHGRCALLGCEGRRAVAGEEPRLRVCADCRQATPEAAPFCAWCGSAAPADAGPTPAPRPSVKLQARPVQGRSWGQGWRALAAAALLLASGLGLGGVLAWRQRAALEALRRPFGWSGVAPDLPQLLRELGRAQERYRREDLDGDGVHAFAPDLPRLLEALQAELRPEDLRAELPLLAELVAGGWTAAPSTRVLRLTSPLGRQDPQEMLEAGAVALAVGRSEQAPETRFYAVAYERGGAGRAAGPVWFLDVDGLPVSAPAEAVRIDPERCALRGAESAPSALAARFRAELLALPGVREVSVGPGRVTVHLDEAGRIPAWPRQLPDALLEALLAAGVGLELEAPGASRAWFEPELLVVRAAREEGR